MLNSVWRGNSEHPRASAIQASFRARGQRQAGRPLRAPLADRIREFLDALPQARGQTGLGLQLLAQANGRMEIARPRPATGGAEKVHPAFLSQSRLRATRTQALFNLRGPSETVRGRVRLLLS